ncbi:GntR family transcriptional regulator [Paenibacillus senegalensis]|uniref:GntR family transcriptional regulator n=1 Tax=Paenibacillus senegalensis TaxID=1465766 RepID=UPI00028A0BDA|nr:GntR family transcriptional regulator [Paenibacillus senegalensis]
MKLNNASDKPLYLQLKQIIMDDIKSGKYQAGEKLPPENELCEQYGVSRITARRAIMDLVDEGILHRKQGKGTFVKDWKVKREIISVGGFSELTTASGKLPSSQILSTNLIEADEKLAEIFSMTDDKRLLRLHRLLYIDNEPFIIETSYYPLASFPDLEQHISESPSTYGILKNRYGIEITRSDKLLDVVLASNEAVELFRCDVGIPLYAIERTSYDQKERPVHYSYSLLMTSKVKFVINAKRDWHDID